MILELFLEGTRAYQGDILRKSISGQRHSKCKAHRHEKIWYHSSLKEINIMRQKKEAGAKS